MGRDRDARAWVAVAVLGAVGWLLAGCSGGGPVATFDPAATTITYSFTDSSVPPEYHRSFDLTIADGTGTVVVRTYDEEVAREEAAVDPAAVNELVTAYNDGDLSEVFATPEDDDGCTGGTGVAIVLDDGEHQDEAELYVCDDANTEAATQLRTAVAPLLAAFDIEEVTEGRYAG